MPRARLSFRAVPVCLALLSTARASPAPRPGEDLTVLGFSGDGERFAAVTAAPGRAQGTLRLWDAATGEPVDRAWPGIPLGAGRRAAPPPALLAELDLGGDPGTERYASGTPLATDFAWQGAPLHVGLTIRAAEDGAGWPGAAVLVRRGACTKELPTVARGREFNLVSVLGSRDGGTLAVVFKFTDGGVRRHGVALARLADGALAGPGCLGERSPRAAQAVRGGRDRKEEPAPSSRCLEKLRSLRGRYSGVERVRDSSRGAEVPLFRLTIEARADRPSISLFESPGVGAVACGEVAECQPVGGELVVTTHAEEGGKGGCDEASLRLLPRPDGALEVEYHGMRETYLRD